MNNPHLSMHLENKYDSFTPHGIVRHLSTEPNLDYWKVLHNNTYRYLSYESALTYGIAFATYNLKLIGVFS